MSRNFEFDFRPRIRSGWNISMLVRRGYLTDKKIAEYEKAGWYSAAFRDARRELMQKKAAKRMKREGNFLNDGGRLIYSPK